MIGRQHFLPVDNAGFTVPSSWIVISITLLLTSTQTLGLSFQRNPRSPRFPATGVTSLVTQDDGTIIAGTKKGQTLCSNYAENSTSWEELPGYTSKFPVYSLASGKIGDQKRIFCGGGDRYISVWGRDLDRLRFVETLGPHTGWVKDLAYDEASRMLFSIGCNCIETWNCKDSPISHVYKRTIENSPDMGSTLSSDLLSLCLVEGGCLVSGGVDGRIHFWSSDPREMTPLFSKACHEGRVNSLVYASSMKTLFSVGHDGKLNAFDLSSACFVLNSELEIVGHPRLTRLFVVEEASDHCALVLGTTDGQVILINVDSRGSRLQLAEVDRIELEKSPMIYAICSSGLPEGARGLSILVGHATGIVEIGIDYNL
jgi:WD40 repeat protein